MRIARVTAYMFASVLFCRGYVIGAQQIATGPHSITATAGRTTLAVDALRDDILRVRMWKGDAVPEDASWAVLPASRTSRVSITSEPDGFATRALRVLIGEHLELTVSDLSGHVLQKDASPGRQSLHRQQAAGE
jgi:alpha-glucosidase